MIKSNRITGSRPSRSGISPVRNTGNPAANGRKALDAAIRQIADRAFSNGFTEMCVAAAKLSPRGSSRRSILTYIEAVRDVAHVSAEAMRRRALAAKVHRARRQAGRAGAAS